MTEVALIRWGIENGKLREVLAMLLLNQDENPDDVPLHDLDFRVATLGVETGESVSLRAVKMRHAAIARGGDGNLFLARPGDWLLRTEDGSYALLRTVAP